MLYFPLLHPNSRKAFRMKTLFLRSFSIFVFLFPSFVKSVVHEVPQYSQLSINVTLYPHDVALIKERRKATLQTGSNKLLIKDVPALILMDTFLFRIVPPSPPLKLLEYSFRSSHITREELLKHSVGKLVSLLPSTHHPLAREARLLSLDGGQAIIRVEGTILSVSKDQIAFPRLPHTLVAEPMISLKTEASQEGESFFEMGYLTKGFSWETSYTITVDAKEERLDIHNWITLHNKSGMNIKKGLFRIAHTHPSPDQFYNIPHPLTLPDQSTKNISWFFAKNLKPAKSFCIFPKNNILLNEEGLIIKPSVEAWLSVPNTKAEKLGIPLPEGGIKVFKRTQDGSLFYVGENKTPPIPVDKLLSLRFGTTTDIQAEMRQTDFRKLGNQIVESGYRLDLKNMTKFPRQVTIFQPVAGEWVVLRESHPHTEEEKRLRWVIELAPQESVSLRFRVRMNMQGEA